MNPNGLIFGSGSVVSASGVMAFASATPWGKPTGTVTNAGVLTATDNGTVALVGTSVSNSGTISAPGGEVILAAGSTVTPIVTDGGLLRLCCHRRAEARWTTRGIVSAETLNGKTGT
ncbi:filamentous hemeagglutinin family protein, partial [mine drainage metagenome]